MSFKLMCKHNNAKQKWIYALEVSSICYDLKITADVEMLGILRYIHIE